MAEPVFPLPEWAQAAIIMSEASKFRSDGTRKKGGQELSREFKSMLKDGSAISPHHQHFSHLPHHQHLGARNSPTCTISEPSCGIDSILVPSNFLLGAPPESPHPDNLYYET